MTPNPRLQDERLDALYAELPSIECRGKCFDSCGPIEMSVRERARIETLSGPVTCHGIVCNKLVNNRCSVYSIRPMICRLWGLIESLPCHYGCRPEGGLLSNEEGFRFIARALDIGGGYSLGDQRIVHNLERLAAELSAEEFRRRVDHVSELVIPKPRRIDARSDD